MKKLLLSGITAVALMAAGTAQAGGLSLTGETGVMRTPLAMALAPMTFAVAADYVASEDTFIPMRVEFGVFDGLEIGGNYWLMDTNGDPTLWGVNAKYVLPIQLVENLAIAVGLNYQSNDNDFGDFSATTVSGVATYNALVGEMAVIPSLGVAFESQGGDADESGVRFFGSVIVKVMPELALGAEFVSTDDGLDGEDADISMWFGARYMTPVEGLTVQAGMINNANVGGAADEAKDFVFHVGGQYAFSFGN